MPTYTEPTNVRPGYAPPARPARGLSWPPILPATIAADLEPLREEHERVTADYRKAREVLAEMQRAGAAEAERQDEEASVAAIRAGKAIPPPKALRDHAARMADQERTVSRLQAARDAIARDVSATVAEHQGEYRAALDQERAASVQSALEALDTISEATRRVQDLDSALAWVGSEGRKVGRQDPRVGRDRLSTVLAGLRGFLTVRTEPEATGPADPEGTDDADD
jgi:hypothetical protein